MIKRKKIKTHKLWLRRMMKAWMNLFTRYPSLFTNYFPLGQRDFNHERMVKAGGEGLLLRGLKSSSSTKLAPLLQFLIFNFVGFKAFNKLEYCMISVSSSSLSLSELVRTSLSVHFLKAAMAFAFLSKDNLLFRFFSTAFFWLVKGEDGLENDKLQNEKKKMAVNSRGFISNEDERLAPL